MKSLSIAVITTLACGAAWAAEPAPKAEATQVVTATGEAAILADDVPMAKEKARDAALREAVNQVVGTTITSATETQDFTLVRDLVFSQTSGYVRKWEKVDEKVDVENGLVSLTVKAEVAKGAIDKDAAAVSTLLGMKKQKRVYVLVNDLSTDTVGAKGAQTVAATRHGVFDAMLREQLRRDGFYTLDPNMVDGKLRNKAALQALSTPQEAMELAGAVGADVVIYGNATAINDEGEVAGVKMPSVMVRVALTAVTPDSGEAIADYTGNVQQASHTYPMASNLAMKKAAEVAIKEIRAGFFAAWRKQLNSDQRVAMSVTGVKDYGTLTAFKNLLGAHVRGVKDITSVRLEKGTASMDVALTGSTDTLASELSGKTFKGMTVSVTKVTPNTVEVVLAR